MTQEYTNVVLCASCDCKVADRCHRAMGYKTITTEDKVLKVVNPMIVTSDEHCPMFSYKKTVRYGCGFMEMERNLPRGTFDVIKQRLLKEYGKNPYYEMRKGTRLISPETQMFFEGLFLEMGIATPYPFDKYVDVEEWS